MAVTLVGLLSLICQYWINLGWSVNIYWKSKLTCNILITFWNR